MINSITIYILMKQNPISIQTQTYPKARSKNYIRRLSYFDIVAQLYIILWCMTKCHILRKGLLAENLALKFERLFLFDVKFNFLYNIHIK